jgi:5-(carboxyamino)imidazole ribonucleotide synthase
MSKTIINQKLGIIAGGQLGKMLIQEACKWDVVTYILDEDENGPAAFVANKFIKGNRFDFDDVYNFGKMVDILTFEIESINTDALFKLKEEGLTILPDPSILKLFQNKEKQKEFYVENKLPTVPFISYDTTDLIIESIKSQKLAYPFVQKLKTGGYDGRGVAVIRNKTDLPKLLPGESIIENLVDIDKEIAIIVSRNSSGEIRSYPAVEMVFDPVANLVDMLVCPADISLQQEETAKEIAHELIEDLKMVGLLAIEFFLDKEGNILINESAPRTHNSGHHTIEGNHTSQFQQHLRAVLGLPLGSTKITSPAVMINLLGAEGHTGNVKYEGFAESLAIEGVNIHLYGKTITKPYRKMGHITITDNDLKKAIEKAEQVKKLIRVVT